MYKEKIEALKKEKNAVILAHFYQNDEIQEVADFVGDSLALSRIASTTNADIIVFCGVFFMAETAKILSPEKKVLLPKKDALCRMASMADYNELKEYKVANPDTIIVTYVNTRANIKALSDVIVTSSNAEKIIKHYQDKHMMYVPDKNLGLYLKDKLNLNIDVWPGYCYIHEELTIKDVALQVSLHPNAELLVHPEAPLEVLKKANYVGSTKQILDYATNSKNNEFIIGTDKGIIHALKKANPNKKFYLLSNNLSCVDMKKISLEDLYLSLKNETFEIEVDENIRKEAVKALNRMMELS